MELVWDHSVVDVLAAGYDVHYGARSIKYEVRYDKVSKISNSSCQLNRPEQTAQTQIRLLLKKQTDQGLCYFAILTSIL